jgi:K+-transporting ATPase ATPase A chain
LVISHFWPDRSGAAHLFILGTLETGGFIMNLYGWLQVIIYLGVILALAKPLGSYMARLFQGEKTFLHPVFGPVERFIYRLGGVKPDADMSWKEYALALLLFNVLGILVVYALQRLQLWLPLNLMKFGPVPPDQAFNTAVSFATNTNWQSYGGETTMSYLTQMLGLAVQNFLSAATGMAAPPLKGLGTPGWTWCAAPSIFFCPSLSSSL